MRNVRFLLGLALALLWVTGGRGETPDWLNASAALPTPAFAAKAPAIVLLDDTTVEVDAKGVSTMVHRKVLRILHNAGSNKAAGGVAYNGASDKVLSLGAWLIRKGETFATKKKNDWLDLATGATGAAIDEQRTVLINLSDIAIAGDIFGYETKLQSPLVVAQLRFGFGANLPIVSERLQLTLPAGFSIEEKTFGPQAPVAASPQRNVWTWTLTDRPYRPEEPYEEPTARVDAELFVRILAPAGASKFTPRSFSDWAEVVDLYEVLNAGQCDSSPALVAKVRELVPTNMDALAKIRALGGYVQKLRYIAINKGLSQGFGWKPRKASTVFSSGYGDCKDKANLLVAMLREAGLRAHPVGAFSGKERVVQPECPTPVQFNHAIVAIEVDDTIQLPAVVTGEKLGRLLIFDPTDPYTQVGDLPFSIQGSLVHVETPGSNSLIPLPAYAAQDDFRIDRKIALTLSADGACTISGGISAAGQTGAGLRQQIEMASLPKDLEQLVARQLNEKFRGAAIQEKKTEDDRVTGRAALSFVCSQPNYLQRLQGQVAIVKLDILSRHYLPNFSEKDRQLPILLPPLAINDEISLVIPQGYAVDELPVKTSLESSYGSCSVSYELAGGTLFLKRVVVLNQSAIPVEEYAKLRQFLSDIAKADRTSVLLKRQG